MKTLIINADDVGFSDAVNKAVERCYSSGVITGVSLAACGKAFREGVSMLKNLGKIEVGAHLTLTGQLEPCVRDVVSIRSLLKSERFFVKDYREFIARYFFKKINSEHVYLEFKSQIEKIRNEKLVLTHLDSHEHIHVLPGILKVVMRLAKEFRIPYIRIPLERLTAARGAVTFKNIARHISLKLPAIRAKSNVFRENLKCSDFFLGHLYSGEINEKVMYFMIKNLKDGVTELAVHPSVKSLDFLRVSPWFKNGPVELDVLLNGKWRDLLFSLKISLVPHSNLVKNGAGEGI